MALTESQRNAIRHPLQWFFEKEPKEEGAIPRRELTFHALGLIGQNQLYNMPGGGWFFHFCTNVLKIPTKYVGYMSSAITFFDACNDPIAGAIIDRHRFPDGKKLTPWIKYTSPFIAVLAFLLFVNWGFESTSAKITYCVVLYLIWDCLYSFQDSALWGITAIISPASGQRARASQWASNGAFIGGLLPGLLLGFLSGDGAFGMTQQQVYLMFAVVMCLFSGMAVLFATKITERVPSLPKQEPFFRNIGVLRHNHIMLLILLSDVINAFSPKIDDIYLYQQMQYSVFGKIMSAGTLVLILTTLTGLPGTALRLFATKIAARMGGMKRIMIIGRVFDIATKLIGFFIGIDTFPKLALVYSLQIVSMLPNSLYDIANRSMLADSVDYVEWKTDMRTEGITMSMRNFQSKLCGAISRFMQGQTLHFLQYDAELVEKSLPQNAHFKKWSWPVYKLGPLLGLTLSLIPLLLLRYPDSTKQQVEADLAQRRALNQQQAEKEVQ